MPVIILPDPAATRVLDMEVQGEVLVVQLDAASPSRKDALAAVLERALTGGYGLELRLLHYEGTPDMRAQAAARKARKAGRP